MLRVADLALGALASAAGLLVRWLAFARPTVVGGALAALVPFAASSYVAAAIRALGAGRPLSSGRE